MTEHIVPAIRLGNVGQMSPEEFQSHLYEYFEEKGILCDLRAHLRTQMIRALKDTNIGKHLVSTRKEMSPKLQALNLLIAEHLLQKEYHYSLSVFSTEVPLNNIFPTFANEMTQQQDLLYRFSENDMWDILETLGFMQASDQGKTVSGIYKSNSQESLLNCILRTCNSSKAESKTNIDVSKCVLHLEPSGEITLETFIKFLKKSGIGPDLSLQIIEQLKDIITSELSKMQENKNEEITKIKEKLEQQANRKLEQYKKKLGHMESVFDKERKRLETELEGAKENLKECAQSLQLKYRTINKLDESLKLKERQLTNQSELLAEKEKMLQKQLEDAVVEKINYRELKEKLGEISVASNMTMIKQTEEKAQQTIQNVNLENVLLRQNAHQLQLKIDGLREQNMTYLSRIQELAMRTSTLMSELQDSQQRVHQLNGTSRGQCIGIPLAVPSVPTISYRTQYGIASYSGAGEEGSNIAPLTPRYFKNMPTNKDHKKRPSRKQDSPNSSDEASPTETVLQEAKQRLQTLEQESDRIDQYYENCSSHSRCKKLKKSDPNSSPSSILGDFQTNLQCICHSLTRIFNKENLAEEKPGPSSQSSQQENSIIYERLQEKPSSQKIKVKNLIADLPVNIQGEDFDDIMKSLGMVRTLKEDNPASTTNSSAFMLGVSFSTVDLSPEVKSDGDNDAKLTNQDEGEAMHCEKVRIWDSVGLSCLLAFIFELCLFR